MSEFTDRRIPAIFLSHGAPPLADDETWTRELADWSGGFARPTAVLVISAHWEEDPLTVGATTTVPLYYDFWGFPRRYYEVTYPAPGAPALAAEVRRLLADAGYQSQDDPERGLDHGAYVPLMEMFPEANVPVLQISMPTLDPQAFASDNALRPSEIKGCSSWDPDSRPTTCGKCGWIVRRTPHPHRGHASSTIGWPDRSNRTRLTPCWTSLTRKRSAVRVRQRPPDERPGQGAFLASRRSSESAPRPSGVRLESV